MSKIGMLVLVLVFSLQVNSQEKPHKIVFDLSSTDTAVQSVVLRQMNNILKAAPGSKLEVVCHGPAVYLLVKEKSFFEETMKELKSRGDVSLKVCANSMKRLGIVREELLPLAEIVPVAILELSTKQNEGWSYIKAGK